MQTIQIKVDSGDSIILLGEKLQNLKKYLPSDRKIILVTDENILKYYGVLLSDWPIIKIGLGEKNKTLRTLELIFSEFVRLEVDRSSFIVAIGGGIVCDTVGFAASVYMRGIAFGFVSTTLLSQVDASVGGKNGVNFEGYKNMIGVFSQPRFVLCDIHMLRTLPDKEFKAGFAEIIKSAAIRDKKLFEYLEKYSREAIDQNEEILEHMIYKSVHIKSIVVQKDEKEQGERKILNFGHTFAHSIEKNLGILHGEAVSIGMVLAARTSVKLGLLDLEKAERLRNLLVAYDLPVELNLNKEKTFEALLKDKKREGQHLHLVLLDDIGHAIIKKVPINLVEEIVYDLC